MILHLTPYDKFIKDYVVMSRSMMPDHNANTFYFFTNQPKRYLKEINEVKIPIIKDYQTLQKIITKVDKVVFHSLNKATAEILRLIPVSTKKIWILWGYELYGAFPSVNFIEFHTHRHMSANPGLLKFSILRAYQKWKKNYNKSLRSQILQMDVLATYIREEFELAQKINPHLEFVDFRYVPLELRQSWPSFQYNKINRIHTVWVGNSLSPYNNHIEVLRFLKQKQYQGKIILPVSYGSHDTYKNNLYRLGKKYFKNRFYPLEKFLPRNEYINKLTESDVLWFNNIRQMAMGNILLSLLSGRPVILNKKNTTLPFFERKGIKIFTQKDWNNIPMMFDYEIAYRNSELVKEIWDPSNNEGFFALLSS